MKFVKNILIVAVLSATGVSAKEVKNLNSEGLNSSRVISNNSEVAYFNLKYTNAAVMRAKIKPFLKRNDTVMSFKHNNILVIKSDPKTIKEVKKLIDKVEIGNSKEVVMHKLKNVSTNDIYDSVNALAKLIFPQTINSEKVAVVKSEATNSLIFVGKKENIEKLLKYTEQLDVKSNIVKTSNSNTKSSIEK